MPYRIFIGYSHEDEKTADYIWRCLAGIEEFQPIKAERYQLMGEDFKERLQQHLRGSFAMIVLLTEHGKNSQWVNQELGYAYALKTEPRDFSHLPHIIPISQENVQLKGFVTKDQQDILILERFQDMEFVVASIIQQLRWRIPNGAKEGALHRRLQCPRCLDGRNLSYEWSGNLPAEAETLKAMELNQYTWIYECPKCKAECVVDIRTMLPIQ
jgi:hypothetical protein